MIHVSYDNKLLKYSLIGGRDSSVGKSLASYAGDPGLNPGGSLTRNTPMQEWQGKRLPAV